VQEAVVDYWKSVAPPGAVAQHLWVALKHEITYLKPTFLQDNVVAEVIAQKVAGPRAFFRTIVRRGDEVLSEIDSCWCCLDAATRRPARPGREIVRRFFPSPR
jgi:acyl-CoA thioester hydrolase